MSVELVEVVRSGFRECVHRGSLVVLDPRGEVIVSLGEVHTPVYPRSSNKPLQATAMLRLGFAPRNTAELAIATASHEGESDHVELVEELLAHSGFGEDALQCPADLPGNELARAEVLAAGRVPRPTYMNCSGKHAAMLATCAANDWPTANYLDSAHPLQRAVVETILDLTGDIEETDLGIDGCGLPIVPVPLINLARAYSRLATADPDTPERAVADAIREHPFLISGSGKDDLRLIQAVPGLMCKAGADGIHAGALPDGSAFAFKIDDGHERARLPLTAAVLTRLGIAVDEKLAALASQPVLGGGARVGTVRAVPGVF
ncbi:asparaginase [Rhodococcus sp. HNM0563]|uniref:asparaginase n=1 Tax=unclassified Rhodococcus (in: high G+C Gram-positive bacteria) TaxID=192944 RepID=UPI00146C1FC9|nr:MULTISPECIES: asparaginase [unclassified Rhodococcus (in: high G+C Gram-positive bacteria)]MCK0089343.1 asparaginase [Rhodococcus sp. F64268]NLU62870.1 asparaginase [Rhodococcus sp. HNM0563]